MPKGTCYKSLIAWKDKMCSRVECQRAGLSHMLVMNTRHEDSLFSKINDVDITGQLAS